MASVAAIQVAPLGAVVPPSGSDIATKIARLRHVSPADHQVIRRSVWWIHTRRNTSTKTSSVTSSGWTTDISPACSASA